MPAPEIDPYAVLGVPPSASAREITVAYRRLVRTLHPDTGAGRPDARHGLDEVLAAYRTLHDPRRRAAHDATRRRRERSRRPATDAQPVVRVHRSEAPIRLRTGPVHMEFTYELPLRRDERDAVESLLAWLLRPLRGRGD
ncbi:J domain-containing protein [Streptomyces lydicus]|uniref:J domain-containing protein n=1 Tax=Streptomyces lydicus TaxID=47763 RepID=UPI0028702A2E|nr:J domain-containing protein [Streptomyces lydicus]